MIKSGNPAGVCRRKILATADCSVLKAAGGVSCGSPIAESTIRSSRRHQVSIIYSSTTNRLNEQSKNALILAKRVQFSGAARGLLALNGSIDDESEACG